MPYQPTLRDTIMLDAPVAVKVSPGGQRVAILVRTTNWKEDRYESVCHIHDLANGTSYPLNRSGSAQQMEWLDDSTLALLRQGRGADAKAQVYLYEGLTGDGWPVTDHKTGVEWFKPFAGGFLYRGRHPERDENKPRADLYGKYTHVEQEDSASALYYVGLEELRQYRTQIKASTEDEAKSLVAPVIEVSRLLEERLAIRDVIPSPAGDAIYINTWKREDLVYLRDTRAYCIRLDARAALAEHVRREKAKKADKKEAGDAPAAEDTPDEKEDLSYLGQITRLQLPRVASVVAVAPDGRRLAVTYQGRDDKMYTYFDLWLIDTQAALDAPDPTTFLEAMRNVSSAIDQQLMAVTWVESGLYTTCPEGTRTQALRLGPDDQVLRLELGEVFPVLNWQGLDVATTGRIVLIGANAQTVAEVYLAEPTGDETRYQVRQLTGFGQAVESWELGTVETIRWTEPRRHRDRGRAAQARGLRPDTPKYPLVFVVHGGPIGVSTETLLSGEDRAYYPSVQFVNKGVLVLKPNYRGSIGRGQAFTELNVNNLGVGDLWDLESAIDHLAALGWVDAERVGCMGWSQGGYISAFAGLHSEALPGRVGGSRHLGLVHLPHQQRHPGLHRGLSLRLALPQPRAVHQDGARSAGLAEAQTPMLIQHGTEDRRVPLSNAMELYRGLKAMGVPVELFVFPGMGAPHHEAA